MHENESSRQSSRKTHLSSTHWAMTADTTSLVNKAFVGYAGIDENGPTSAAGIVGLMLLP